MSGRTLHCVLGVTLSLAANTGHSCLNKMCSCESVTESQRSMGADTLHQHSCCYATQGLITSKIPMLHELVK